MAPTLRPGSSKRKFLENAPDATLLKRKKATGLDSPSSLNLNTSSVLVNTEKATSSFSTPPTIIPKFSKAWLQPNVVPTDYYRAITEYSHWPPLLFNFSTSSGVRQPSYFARFAFATPIKFVFGHPLDSALANLKTHLDGRSTPQPLVQAFNASAQGHELYTIQGYELNHEGALDKRMYAEFERPALTVLRDGFWKEAASHRSVNHTLSRVGVEGDCNWSNLDLQITTQQLCESRSGASSDSSEVDLEDLTWDTNAAIEWKTRHAFAHVRGLVAMVKGKEVTIASGPNGEIYHDRRLVTGMVRICVQIWEDMFHLKYGSAIISDGEQFVIFKLTGPGVVTISDVYGYHSTNLGNLGTSFHPWRSETIRKLEKLREEHNEPSLVDQSLPSHVSVVTEAQVWGDCKSKKREKIVLPRAAPCGTGLFGAWVALALEDVTNGKDRIHEYYLVHEERGEELNKKGLRRLGRGKLKDTQVTVDLQEDEIQGLYEEEPEDGEDGLEVEE